MAPTTRKQSKSADDKKALETEQYAKRAIRNSRKALLLDVCEGMVEAYKNNGNRLPYGHVEELVKKLVTAEPWITRNIINKAFMRHKRESLSVKETTATTQHSTKKSNTAISSTTNVKSVINTASKKVPDSITIGDDSGNTTTESDLTGESTRWKSRVGRPSGSTEEKKFHQKRKIIEVKNECARQFASLKKRAKETTGKRVSPCSLEEIIQKVSHQKNLHGVTITPSTIRRRFYRK